MSKTYPCNRCNMDDGSPLCLQDSRCPRNSENSAAMNLPPLPKLKWECLCTKCGTSWIVDEKPTAPACVCGYMPHVMRCDKYTSDQVRQAQRDAVSELAIASDARIAGLQDQINRDSVELRSLCQARDDARKERDAAKAMASELEKDRDYCEKQWHEALATHENIEALKSRIAELEAALRF